MIIEIVLLTRQNYQIKNVLKEKIIYYQNTPQSIAEGSPGFPFEIELINGTKISVKDSMDTNILLIFFSVNCSACSLEIPLWRQLYHLPEREFKILGICRDDLEKTSAHAKKYELPFTIGIDADRKIFEKYNVRTIPQKIFLDRNGIIRYVERGTNLSLLKSGQLLDLWKTNLIDKNREMEK
ncbi:MAG: peroxiredoxin family protein [candidate division KSB1 bacterium]|nr:peroxiredoxin family protein [candidate division KSB1 bacterium]